MANYGYDRAGEMDEAMRHPGTPCRAVLRSSGACRVCARALLRGSNPLLLAGSDWLDRFRRRGGEAIRVEPLAVGSTRLHPLRESRSR